MRPARRRGARAVEREAGAERKRGRRLEDAAIPRGTCSSRAVAETIMPASTMHVLAQPSPAADVAVVAHLAGLDDGVAADGGHADAVVEHEADVALKQRARTAARSAAQLRRCAHTVFCGPPALRSPCTVPGPHWTCTGCTRDRWSARTARDSYCPSEAALRARAAHRVARRRARRRRELPSPQVVHALHVMPVAGHARLADTLDRATDVHAERVGTTAAVVGRAQRSLGRHTPVTQLVSAAHV